MKRSLWIPLLTLGFAGGYGTHQDALATEIRALQEKVEALEALSLRVDALEAYITEQAAQMKAFGTALDDSVSKGFTVGENFPARKVLVAAWKAQVAAAARNVPGAKTAATEHVDPRIRRQRELEKKKRGGDGQ